MFKSGGALLKSSGVLFKSVGALFKSVGAMFKSGGDGVALSLEGRFTHHFQVRSGQVLPATTVH